MTPKLACADFTFPLLAPRQVARPDRHAGLRGGRHRPLRRAVAPLALARLRRPEGVGQGAGGQAARPRARAGRCVPPDRSRFRLDRPQSSRSLDPSPGARLVRANRRVRPRVRRPAHLGACRAFTFDGEPEAESYERCRDELAWRCQTASSQGVTFSVEAHVGSIVPTPESAARLVQSVPGLTLTLDYTHFTRERRRPTPKWSP